MSYCAVGKHSARLVQLGFHYGADVNIVTVETVEEAVRAVGE